MRQTIAQIKTSLLSIKPDAGIVEDPAIIQLINEVDGSIHYDIHKDKLHADIALIANTVEYSLPVNITFDLVDQVYLNDIELPKIDESFKDTTGYLKGSTDNKIKIYPVPTKNDGTGIWSLTVAYLKPFTKHTSVADTVLIDSPFDKLYYEYLSAKISLFKSDTVTFNNMITLYNASRQEYEKWYNERYTNRRG